LSGAFLGGVLLSAVTSLPELFTSISATTLIDDASLCIGNILGSNLFNFGMLAVVILCMFNGFAKAVLSRSHRIVMLLLILMYMAVWLNWQSVVDAEVVLGEPSPWFYMSITSLVIVVLYFLSVRYLAGDNGAAEGEATDKEVTLSLKGIVIRFVAASVGIIVASIILTYITDDIAERLNLGSGLAGAIFLGVATSLPEVTSTISLFRMRNFDIAFGNIAGSNVFNYFVLAIADLLYVRGTVYFFEDSKVVNLTMFGMVASAVMLVMLCSRKMWVKVAMVMAAIGCYFAFLLV
jgi:cation:H+ antiporter